MSDQPERRVSEPLLSSDDLEQGAFGVARAPSRTSMASSMNAAPTAEDNHAETLPSTALSFHNSSSMNRSGHRRRLSSTHSSSERSVSATYPHPRTELPAAPLPRRPPPTEENLVEQQAKIARKVFIGGCFFLPWLWIVNLWYFRRKLLSSSTPHLLRKCTYHIGLRSCPPKLVLLENSALFRTTRRCREPVLAHKCPDDTSLQHETRGGGKYSRVEREKKCEEIQRTSDASKESSAFACKVFLTEAAGFFWEGRCLD